MPKFFDEFDLELQKIDMDITPYSDSGGDSVAVCSGGGGGTPTTPSHGPTCLNVCN